MEKSMLDVAYQIVESKKGPVSFKDLIQGISEIMGIPEEEMKGKIARFYTNLTLDGRFVTLGENTWDLRARNKYEKVHIDMNDVYKDDDEADDVEEEEEIFDEEPFTEEELKKNAIIVDVDNDMEGE